MIVIEGFEFPEDLLYDTKEHLWLRAEGSSITIGIDDGGQDALGDVVYLQLAAAGRRVSHGQAIGSVEAAKMVRPLLAPVSGTVSEVNPSVMVEPRLVNADPYGQAWLVRIAADDWESERRHFVQGGDAVTNWVRSELAAHART